MAKVASLKIKFRNLCLLIAILSFFLYTMMESTLFFITGFLFTIPSIIGFLSSPNTDLKKFCKLILIGSVLDILVTSYGIGGSIVFFLSCCITYSCLHNLKIFFVTSLVLCVWLIAFLYYQMLVLGTVNGDIFLDYGLSKNYPGSLLVIFNSLWAVWKYLHYNKMPLLLPILSTILCFFLDGRSSLICITLITVYCFLFRGKHMVYLMSVIAVFLLIHYWQYLMGFYELSSVATRGTETVREDIWADYFRNLDPISLLFGLDTQNLPIIKHFEGNPHNSFLSMHRRMGLLGLGTLMYYIFYAFRKLISRKMYPYLFLLFVLLVRMFFDGMLTTAEDFFILTLIFVPICFDNPSFRIREQLQTQDNNMVSRCFDKIILFL